MKTKISIFLCAIALPLLMLAFGVQARPVPATKAGDMDSTLQIPANAVGVIINGVPHILQNRLKWTFTNGATISSIQIKSISNGFFMVRRGTQIGAIRTESFQLSHVGNYILFNPVIVHVCFTDITLCSYGCEYDWIQQRCECNDDPYTGACTLNDITLNTGDVIILNQ